MKGHLEPPISETGWPAVAITYAAAAALRRAVSGNTQLSVSVGYHGSWWALDGFLYNFWLALRAAFFFKQDWVWTAYLFLCVS